MGNIQFRMAAKTDVGLERANNEDNFQASANLEETPMKWVNNQQYSLGRKGALLVVADGMGGMNAGEVASEIAINTVRECFSPDKITDEVVKTRFTIEKFMKGVIVEADKRIKEFAKDNPESRGMGTTIVIAWLFDGNLYVSWCGDSRAYIFNPNTGLFQISKDHSYVQQLVDAGKISKEDAFDFPDSNIITRSLSDATAKANPDCLLMPQKLCNNDIILLCSDGLNGMIRDEEIENVIVANQGNMTECVDALIKAALDAAGADNCTVALCQILSGGAESDIKRIPQYSRNGADLKGNDDTNNVRKPRHWVRIISLISLIIILAASALWFFRDGLVSFQNQKNEKTDTSVVPIATDSIGEKSTEEADAGSEVDEKDDKATSLVDSGNKESSKSQKEKIQLKSGKDASGTPKKDKVSAQSHTDSSRQEGIKISEGIFITPVEDNQSVNSKKEDESKEVDQERGNVKTQSSIRASKENKRKGSKK